MDFRYHFKRLLQILMKRRQPLKTLLKNYNSSFFLQVKTIIMHELSKIEGQLLTLSLDRGDLQANFGFSLRGGVEHGVGHFVSSVDSGSVAESQGNNIYLYEYFITIIFKKYIFILIIIYYRHEGWRSIFICGTFAFSLCYT